MDALRMSTLSLMTEDQAQTLLDKIQGMALWNADMIIQLSLNGFRAFEIAEYLDNDPMFLLAYLAIREG